LTSVGFVLNATWPQGQAAYARTYFQRWILDPAGPLGLSASNGLCVRAQQ
jgi:hypothetical protein